MDNKALVRCMIDDVFNRRDLTRMSSYLAEACVCHDSLASTNGASELRRVFEGYLEAFTDLCCVIDSQVAEGDMVATRISAVGTNTGPFLGRPPTGRRVRLTGIRMDRVEDGRITEQWVQMDYLTMMQQMDTAPRLERANPQPRPHVDEW